MSMLEVASAQDEQKFRVNAPKHQAATSSPSNRTSSASSPSNPMLENLNKHENNMMGFTDWESTMAPVNTWSRL
jgi:hypothetical protein